MPMRPLLALATLACACGFVPLPRDRWGSARLSKVIDVEPIEPEDSDLDAALGADDAAGAARAASSLSMGEALTTEGRRLDDLVQSASGGLSEDELRAAWTAELQASLNNHGAELCAGAYEGHMRHGRGALMLNFEVDGESAHPAATDALAELVRGRTTELDAGRDGGARGGMPWLYLPLSAIGETQRHLGSAEFAQIEAVVLSYDPEAEFVIFFAHKGVVGIQTPRPAPMPPRYIWESQRPKKVSSQVHPRAYPGRAR